MFISRKLSYVQTKRMSILQFHSLRFLKLWPIDHKMTAILTLPTRKWPQMNPNRFFTLILNRPKDFKKYQSKCRRSQWRSTEVTPKTCSGHPCSKSFEDCWNFGRCVLSIWNYFRNSNFQRKIPNSTKPGRYHRKSWSKTIKHARRTVLKYETDRDSDTRLLRQKLRTRIRAKLRKFWEICLYRVSRVRDIFEKFECIISAHGDNSRAVWNFNI